MEIEKIEEGSLLGPKIYIADMVVIAVTREMGPLLVAVILAGRSGAAFAAEIGTMKVNEELDALTVLDMDGLRGGKAREHRGDADRGVTEPFPAEYPADEPGPFRSEGSRPHPAGRARSDSRTTARNSALREVIMTVKNFRADLFKGAASGEK
jgi:hypothetical protein